MRTLSQRTRPLTTNHIREGRFTDSEGRCCIIFLKHFFLFLLMLIIVCYDCFVVHMCHKKEWGLSRGAGHATLHAHWPHTVQCRGHFPLSCCHSFTWPTSHKHHWRNLQIIKSFLSSGYKPDSTSEVCFPICCPSPTACHCLPALL